MIVNCANFQSENKIAISKVVFKSSILIRNCILIKTYDWHHL